MSDKFQFNAFPTSDFAWRRWEMATFDVAEPQAEPSHEEAPACADHALELEQLRTAAREQAHAQGFASGQKEGVAAGLQKGLAQGRKEGYEAGFAEGLALGRERAERQAAKLEQLAAACAQAVSSVESEVGEALISLAISIAEHVLRGALTHRPERILDVVRDILRVQVDPEVAVNLRVNPADLGLLQEFMSDEPGLKNWQLSADETIERGGCMADTPLGNIDATLRTRWQRAVSSLGLQGHDA